MARRPKTVLTASSLNCLFSCARKYYLSYECGWRRRVSEDALRFGTAFHKGLETWFTGVDAEGSIRAALDTAGDVEFDAETVAQLGALLRGYFAKWGEAPFKVEPEREFAVTFPFLRGIVVCGKMDGVVTLADGKKALIEHKTTGEDIGPLADYWQTINRDQVGLYKAAGAKDGIEFASVIYDVIRKPTIRCGKAESVDEYAARLGADCIGNACGDNPRAKDYKRGADFYFARREIPLLDCDMDALARRLYAAKVMLRAHKKLGKLFAETGTPVIDAWPKCGSSMTCKFCPFRGICHTEELPETEWERGRAHEELEIAKKYLG